MPRLDARGVIGCAFIVCWSLRVRGPTSTGQCVRPKERQDAPAALGGDILCVQNCFRRWPSASRYRRAPAGRDPQPIASVQPQDAYSDCTMIRAEIEANNAKATQLATSN